MLFCWIKTSIVPLKKHLHAQKLCLTKYKLCYVSSLGFEKVERSKNPNSKTILEPNLQSFTSKWNVSQLHILNHRLWCCYFFWISTVSSIFMLDILSKPNFFGCVACIIIAHLCLWCRRLCAFLFFIWHNIFWAWCFKHDGFCFVIWLHHSTIWVYFIVFLLHLVTNYINLH